MRVGMGMIKNEYGVWHVRRKVPKGLEVATARVMDVPKERVSWLKETLGTKDEKQAVNRQGVSHAIGARSRVAV